MDQRELQLMSVIDLARWLKGNGVQDNHCELLEGK